MMRVLALILVFAVLPRGVSAAAGDDADWLGRAFERLQAESAYSTPPVLPRWWRVLAHPLAPFQSPLPEDGPKAPGVFSEARLLGLPLGLDYEAPIFRVPMVRYSSASHAEESLAAALAEFSRVLAAKPETGYDWVFPRVYTLVTGKELEYIRTGRFRRPDLVRLEVGQFYEAYARNAEAWLAGGAPEPAWAAAADLSRRLARAGLLGEQKEKSAACIAVLLESMLAHIAVDLPRCLMIVAYCTQPAPSMDEMREDFFRMTPLFDEVSTELVGEGTITPRVLAMLPPILRRLVAALGVGEVVRLMRRFAWERFAFNLGRGNWRTEMLALPVSASATPLGNVHSSGLSP